MRFFGMRVLRNTPGELWSALDEGETVILTVDGKPRGIVLGTSEADFEQSIEMIRRLRYQLALERTWEVARAGGTAPISDAEIEKEIAAVRRARARHAS